MDRIRARSEKLKSIVFAEIYDRFEKPVAKRKAFGLIEAAIQCYSRMDFERVTLQTIAREAGVTRTLLHHYFNGIDDIRETSIRFVRVFFQRLAVSALQRETDPEKMLGAYIEACFDWVTNHRSHATVWLSFILRCVRNAKARQLQTQAVLVGQERIANLLSLGRRMDVSLCLDDAKLIQTLITGALITSVMEDLRSPKSFAKSVRLHCLTVAKFKLHSPTLKPS